MNYFILAGCYSICNKMKANYIKSPDQVLQFKERDISVFNIESKNIDQQVVNECGEEWLKFNEFKHRFLEDEISQMMINSGLGEIIISAGLPLYHATGKKLS